MSTASAQDVIESIEEQRAIYSDIAKKIWGYAEVGYQEEKSSKLLQSILDEAGFQIETGVAEIPTAFVASYGQGKPVIAILAEYDALPGVGHACGHSIIATASAIAGAALHRLDPRTKIITFLVLIVSIVLAFHTLGMLNQR